MGECSQCPKEIEELGHYGLCKECGEDIYSIMYEDFERKEEKRKYEKIGVEIFNYKQIVEMLKNTITEIIEEIEDWLNNIDYKGEIIEHKFEPEGSGELIRFYFRKKKISLEYHCGSIVGERGEEVEVLLKFLIDNTINSRCLITFDNGDYEERDDGVYPIKKLALDKSEVSGFIDSICEIGDGEKWHK